jgi:RNA 3'-terminal phosphate cyclase (ATP)
MLEIDGSIGEGGVQILRSSLTLSVVFSEPFRIINIRAGRKNPGLQPQHLKAVEAAGKISGAKVRGAEIGSPEVTFSPGKIRPGKFTIDIKTAGSAPLVLQTIFVPLSLSSGSSRVTITGGTHVLWSPCYHYLSKQWMVMVEKIGFRGELHLKRAGFYPQGGGKLVAEIQPVKHLEPLTILNRGKLEQISGISGVANLPRKIAERQRARVINRLGEKYPLNDLRIADIPSRYKGTILLLLAKFEYSSACFFGLGVIGKPAEKVADEAIDSIREFMKTNGVIDEYLADQILIPLILTRGTSIIKVPKITKHLLTNVEIIQRFSQVDISIEGTLGQTGIVKVSN